MLRTIKRQAGGTATTKTGFKTTTKGTPVKDIYGKTIYLSEKEYKEKYPTLGTISKKDPELYIKPPLKEVEVVAAKPSWMKSREEAEKLPEYSFDKFKENVLPNWAGALGVTKDTMSDETKQQRQDWIDKNYVAPKLFAENKGYYEYTDKEREILDKSNLPDWLKKKEQDITNTSNKLQKEKGVIGSLRTPEDMAKVANATQYRFNTGNKFIDTVNPLTGLASMATNLGNARLDWKKGDKSKAFTSIITPVISGAASNLVGKQSNAQFVADNLSPIPVNADKVVQNVKNYTKSISKPLLKNTRKAENRRLVKQVTNNELSLPQSYNDRIQIQEINPNAYTKPSANSSSNVRRVTEEVLPQITREEKEAVNAQFKDITDYLNNNHPDKRLQFKANVDKGEIKIYDKSIKGSPTQGYMRFDVKKDANNNPIWERTYDYPNNSADIDKKIKGLSYTMTELLNDKIKGDRGVLRSSADHSEDGAIRYFRNTLLGKTHILEPSADVLKKPYNQYSQIIEELKQKLQSEGKSELSKKEVTDMYKKLPVDVKKVSEQLHYQYYKTGGKKYKYFL